MPQALIELCRNEGVVAGQVQATGVLNAVDIGLFDTVRGEYVDAFSSTGSFELLSFNGNISTLGAEPLLNAHVLVAYTGHGRTHVVGGQLRSGTVHTVEFMLDVFEDLELPRSLDTVVRLPLFEVVSVAAPKPATPAPVPAVEPKQPVPAPGPPADGNGSAVAPSPPSEPAAASRSAPAAAAGAEEPASATAWQAAARQSQAILAQDDDDVLEDVDLEVGDILMHPRLGECTVVKVDGEAAAYIRIHKSRRISKLALSVVRLEPAGEQDGRRVFNVLAGRP